MEFETRNEQIYPVRRKYSVLAGENPMSTEEGRKESDIEAQYNE